ncbi:glycoside hydrolase family 2 [Candidatus Gracilibacteria bacterium]|nr:glycoside hydrolase family 2 [Candidatus Gracilibacteria bacterium]
MLLPKQHPFDAPHAAEVSIPRPEHPRPSFERPEWQNLNGAWGFRRDPDHTGMAERWFRAQAADFEQTISVPFPWQSERSGIADTAYRGVVWYRRNFVVPSNWQGQRIFLNFGAVDYSARVWVNDQLLGEHEGGYTPFAFDVTDALRGGENTLVVRVDDPVPQDEIPHGKQRNVPPDPWDDVAFTPSSGIWQTVWIEARPATYLLSAEITPDIDRQQATLALRVMAGVDGVAALDLMLESPVGALITAQAVLDLKMGAVTSSTLTLPIPQPQLWDIDTPQLYTATLRLRGPDEALDMVRTSFGMRKIEVRDGKVWLNNRPIYLMSALDQGYWPDGLSTAPSDDAIRADIAYAKSLGLNGLRKHLKIEDPRYAYWADRLGILLWYDTPNPTRFTSLARERLLRDLDGMIARDYNHPSIIVWSPYNESWGLEFRLGTNDEMQAWVAYLYDHIKQRDPTRLVVDNSGWSHVKTDIADSHYYTNDPVEWRGAVTLLATAPDDLVVLGHRFFANSYRYGGEPLMMTEYGGGWREDRSWDLRWQTSELRRHPQIVGYTYTELYDIEHEYAGYAHYDRTPKDFGYDIATVNSADFVGLDYRETATLRPGAEITVIPFISAYAKDPLGAARCIGSWWRCDLLPSPLCSAEQYLSRRRPLRGRRCRRSLSSSPQCAGRCNCRWRSTIMMARCGHKQASILNYSTHHRRASRPARMDASLCCAPTRRLSLVRSGMWRATRPVGG